MVFVLAMPAPSAHMPTMNKILNTAEPTMVPTPTSDLAKKTPEVKYFNI